MDMYLCERFDGSSINATVGFYSVIIPFEYLRGTIKMLFRFGGDSLRQAMDQAMESLP